MADGDRRKWDAMWQDRAGPGEPSAIVTGLASELPRSGRALDLAGGPGRHALWLAGRGLAVTLVDVSPIAVAQAAAAAAARGLAVDARVHDLDAGWPSGGPWDLVLSFHFLARPLLGGLAEHLTPGGLALVVQPTVRNLERHPRPGARFLLGEGELAGLLAGLEVIHLAEGWLAEGRHEAVALVRRPP